MLSVLRSRAAKGKVVGLCLTASHNPEADNGIKHADPDGSVLTMSWEKHATALANAADDKLAEALQSIVEEEKIDMSVMARARRRHGRHGAAVGVSWARAGGDGGAGGG